MSYFPYPVEYFVKLRETWPSKGKQILCTYDSRIIVLYLCTREHVAIKATAEQSLYGKGNLYKSIKWVLRPSFSSAIYGSGWATKIEQQRILALTLPRECFEELLTDSIVCQEDEKPEVRVDWEPDYNPLFSSQSGRYNLVIYLESGSEAIDRFVNTMIKRIEDVTSFVRRQRKVLLGYNGGITEIIYPHEEVLELRDKELEKRIKSNLSGSEFED